MWTTFQLQPLVCVISSSYDTTLLSHGYINNCLIRTHSVLVLCDISVIQEDLIIRPVLCIHVDNISTPTSCVMCSSYIYINMLLLLNLCKPNVNALFKKHILTILYTILYDVFIKPLLCMHIDNISTLTSDMPSVVYTATL